jgi:glycosyltransferase involved in cell wall biosynthesis
MRREFDYPRVLILGYNFDLISGGGITLVNLFRGWPPGKLAVAGFERCDMDPSPCAHQYLLGPAERQWVGPWRLVRFFGAPQHEESADTTSPRPLPDPPVPAGGPGGTPLRPIAKAVFHAAVRFLGSDEYLRPLAASRQLISWAASLKPDLLYTQLASLSMIRLTIDLVQALSVPVALHMMDDWPEVVYRHGLLGRRLRNNTDRGLRAIIDTAAVRMAISEEMAREYTERYGQEWSVFHNPVDLARWSDVGRESRHVVADFRIVYSGRIGPGIDSSVLEVSRAVALLRRQGYRLRFDIHSLHFDRTVDHRFTDLPGVTVHGAVEESEMPATLAGADLLVLPFDFYGEAAAFARLSFPTKAPAYMASGTPVLVYAPRTHAVATNAETHGWGYVVGEPSVSVLADAIVRLMNDETLRSALAHRASKMAEEHYDAKIVRARFAAALSAAARHRLTPSS